MALLLVAASPSGIRHVPAPEQGLPGYYNSKEAVKGNGKLLLNVSGSTLHIT